MVLSGTGDSLLLIIFRLIGNEETSLFYFIFLLFSYQIAWASCQYTLVADGGEHVKKMFKEEKFDENTIGQGCDVRGVTGANFAGYTLIQYGGNHSFTAGTNGYLTPFFDEQEFEMIKKVNSVYQQLERSAMKNLYTDEGELIFENIGPIQKYIDEANIILHGRREGLYKLEEIPKFFEGEHQYEYSLDEEPPKRVKKFEELAKSLDMPINDFRRFVASIGYMRLTNFHWMTLIKAGSDKLNTKTCNQIEVKLLCPEDEVTKTDYRACFKGERRISWN